jgi:DNA-binding NarL/FixJ family response regulator
LTRILIADDHEVVRVGLRTILEAHPGWEVVAEAENGKEAITKAMATKPDIVIMDYSLPMMNGGEATRQIQIRLPNVAIMVLTIHKSDVLVGQLLDAGARAYVLKSDANRHLVAAVESLVHGRPFFNGQVSEQLLEWAKHREKKSLLSPREQEVIQLIAEGHRTKGMAALLSLSVKTVESHRASAMQKLNLTSTAALVRYAFRNKLADL